MTTEPGAASPPLRVLALHLSALCGLALAQPLFDSVNVNLESATPEVFLDQTAVSVVAFAVGIVLLPPLVLLGVVAAARAAGVRAGRAALWVALWLPAAIIVAGGIAERSDSDPWWLLVVAALAAAGLVWLYERTTFLPSVLFVVGFTPVVFLVLFLAGGNVAPLLRGGPDPPAAVRLPFPLVVVVLDELPSVSAMTAAGELDRERMPNLARFAETATWYRDATTMHDFTNRAVPSMLTGRHDSRRLPYWYDHSRTLLTAFGDDVPILAQEAEEDLCRPGRCREPVPAGAGPVHLLVRAVGARLRGLTDGRLGHREHPDREVRFRAFVDALEPYEQPDIAYLHVLLPHEPWIHLADGRRYASPDEDVPGLTRQAGWKRNRELAALARARHLEQTEFTDGLLGELFDRLRALDRFDRSLIVVSADHGISFRPGEASRSVNPKNIEEVAPVPLLVKLPEQRRGEVLDIGARNVDLLATVLDVAGAPAPGGDGRSLLGPLGRTTVEVYPADPELPAVELPLGQVMRARDQAIRRRLAERPPPVR